MDLVQSYSSAQWLSDWSQIVPGKFFLPNSDAHYSDYTNLMFYRASDGLSAFYSFKFIGSTPYVVAPTSFSIESGYSIVVAGNFNGAGGMDIFGYNPTGGTSGAGRGAFYDNTFNGSGYPTIPSTPSRVGNNLSNGWSHIVGGTFDSAHTDLTQLFFFYRNYTSSHGFGAFYAPVTSGSGLSIIGTPISDFQEGSHGVWTHVVAGLFHSDAPLYTDLLFYNSSNGYYSIQSSDGAGGLTEIGSGQIASGWTKIVSGSFGGGPSGLLFYKPDQMMIEYVSNGSLFEGGETARQLPSTDIDIIVPGQFAVTNQPDSNGDQEDVKFGDENYTDVLFYRTTGSTRGEFWRRRPAGEWYRGKVEGYVSGEVYSNGDISESVAPGEHLHLHLSSSASPGGTDHLTVAVTRKGDPDVAMSGSWSADVGEQSVPDDPYRGCGWATAITITIPSGGSAWPSGLYVATVTSAKSGCSTTIPFVVRPASYGATTNILCVLASGTYQAYNWWGGRSLYGHGLGAGRFDVAGADLGFVWDTPRAFKVSLDRPYAGPNDFPNVGPDYDHVINAPKPELQYWELPFIKWLDRRGITVEFCTSGDIDRDGANILDPVNHYTLVLTVGHDEYWSGNMKSNFESFAVSGGNTGFFSGNTCWWRTRYEDHGRTIVCYKNKDFDPSSTDTVHFADYAGSTSTVQYLPPETRPNTQDPETTLTGVSWANGIAGWPADPGPTPFTVLSSSSWVFNGTSLANSSTFGLYKRNPNDPSSANASVVGWEADAKVTGRTNSASNSPSGFTSLANVVVGGTELATMGIFTRSGGGTTFTAATTDWSLGLSKTGTACSPIDRITLNVLETLGGASTTNDCDNSFAMNASGLAVPSFMARGELPLFTVTVRSGVAPTGSMTVTANLSSLGMSSTSTLYDDGTHGDVIGGDNVFTTTPPTGPTSWAAGTYTLPYSVTQNSTTVTGSMTLVVVEAGATLATATAVNGGGNISSLSGYLSVDGGHIYHIHVRNPGIFTASTVGGSAIDTQLFLLDNNGHAVACNDDDPAGGSAQSYLTHTGISSFPVGDYYLIITGFNVDPVDSGGALLFDDQPFNTQHTADGSSNAFYGYTGCHWGGAYTIYLTGVNGSSAYCTNDFNGNGSAGEDADIEAFFACLSGSCCSTCGSPDFNGNGSTGEDADIEAFFRVLAGGPC